VTNVDTSSDGSAQFPSTLWTDVLHAGDQNSERLRAAWEALAKRYWKPVYAYARFKWAKSDDDAKDLTQDFFTWMIETDFPGRANRDLGRFRVFIKVALENYLKMDLRSRQRLKRGGKRQILKLDREIGDLSGFEIADHAGKTPDQVMEESWKREILARGTRHLQESYSRAGKDAYFLVFRDFYLGEQGKVTHEELAAKYGVSLTDVNNYLMDAKRAFREILKDLLSETVERSEDLHAEFKALFGKDGS
jgi:RNA polymerase sigma-70 factor (ECF subfamily)